MESDQYFIVESLQDFTVSLVNVFHGKHVDTLDVFEHIIMFWECGECYYADEKPDAVIDFLRLPSKDRDFIHGVIIPALKKALYVE